MEDLTVEDCQYFELAIFKIMYRGNDENVCGVPVGTILKKTDGGDEFVDFYRWRNFPDHMAILAMRVSDKLNVPEIRVVKRVARREKAYARRQKPVQ